MNYSVIGSGKPLILLHGSMSNNPWYGFELEISKYYKVYLPDLPGFGASETIKGKLHNTELFTESFCEFLEKEHLTNAPVVAFSLGAVIALKAASAGCLKSKLILIGLPGEIHNTKMKYATLMPVFLKRLLASTNFGRKRILIPIFKELIGIEGNEIDAELFNTITYTDNKSLVDINIPTEITTKISTLIAQNRNETTYIYGSSDKLFKSIKNLIASPVVIEGANHIVFSTHRKKLLAVIRQVLS